MDRARFIRRPDWQARLVACVAEAGNRPFERGVHDCALFVADAVLAMTGEDPARALRGTYSDVKGAARALGGRGLRAFVSARLEAVPVALAHEGDIALVREGRALALGVVLGERIACTGQEGLTWLPRERALAAYALPFGEGA